MSDEEMVDRCMVVLASYTATRDLLRICMGDFALDNEHIAAPRPWPKRENTDD